jgi:transposase-like protein
METQKMTCPRCGDNERQRKSGKTGAESQRYNCGECDKCYTPDPKKWKYAEEERKEALKMLVNRGTGRGIGKQLGMHHSNAYRWAREEQKKRRRGMDKPAHRLRPCGV